MAADNGDDSGMGDDSRDGDNPDEEVIEEHEFEAAGWDEIPDDPEKASRVLSALEGVLPDVVKRTLSAGVGSISASEERIRDVLSEKDLPSEVVAYLLSQADETKQEFFRILSKEIREVLEQMDFGGELAKILTRLSLEARVEVRFVENEDSDDEDSVEPHAAGKVRVTQDQSSDDKESED